MWLLAEMRADNTTYEYNGSNRGLVLNETVDDFVTTPDNTGVSTMWNNSYAAILQSNTILDRIDPVTYADPAAKNRVIGEAKFLRALHYFNLVRLFGDVPVLAARDAIVRRRIHTARAPRPIRSTRSSSPT